MKQTTVKLLALSGALVLTASCNTSKQISTSGKLPSSTQQSNIDRQYLILSDSERQVIDSNNKFALQLFGKMTGLGSNVVSPVSVTYLLAMLANGAEGSTRDDIMHVLQLSNDDIDVCNALYHMMIEQSGNVDKACALNIANYFAINKNINIKTEYANKMKSIYQAGIERLDFSSAKTTDHINKWCKEQTRGMIPSIISAVSPDAMAYIMNAISFNGTWSTPFNKRDTQQEPFRGYTRDINKVPMMHQTEKMPYWSTDTYSAVKIPYGNGTYSMTVYLPKDGISVDDMMKHLQDKNVSSLAQNAEDCIVDLKLPRFSTSCETSLNEIISTLGGSSIFLSDSNFKKISDTDMHVSKMFQKAKIEVSEEGTKAAAVTAAIMTMSAMPDVQPKRVSFHANKPFVYIISERNSGAIFFIGQYTGK